MSEKLFNILIVGNGAEAFALAQKLSLSPEIGKIYITPVEGYISDKYEIFDIRENSLTDLLKLVIDNNIDLTIPVSSDALLSEIASFFQANGQAVFAPSRSICRMLFDRINIKKFLYKVHAQCPKFAIFNKFQNAYDYLSDTKFPVVISAPEYSKLNNDSFVCPTMRIAVDVIDDMYKRGETDIIIEDFIYGKNFTLYFVTDGYTILPLNSVYSYKFDEKGLLNSGDASFCPNIYLSKIVSDRVQKIANNLIKSFELKGSPYIGFLGISGTLTGNDNFYVNDIKPFMQKHDAKVILNSLDDDLFRILMACVNGYFSDEYDNIKTNDLYSAEIVVSSNRANQEIKGVDKIEDNSFVEFINVNNDAGTYFSKIGDNFVLAKSASTLANAKKYLKEDIDVINFDGMIYNKEIFK